MVTLWDRISSALVPCSIMKRIVSERDGAASVFPFSRFPPASWWAVVIAAFIATRDGAAFDGDSDAMKTR
jgi:hypothetical protein